jgi:hypothetical protein
VATGTGRQHRPRDRPVGGMPRHACATTPSRPSRQAADGGVCLRLVLLDGGVVTLSHAPVWPDWLAVCLLWQSAARVQLYVVRVRVVGCVACPAGCIRHWGVVTHKQDEPLT